MTSYFYSAFVKFVIIALLLSLWPLAQPYADQIKLVGQWLLAKNVYPFVNYQLMQSLQQVVIFVQSYFLLMWIFAPKGLDMAQTGFTSNTIHND